MHDQIERKTAGLEVPAAWVVGARTMLVDRIVPQFEYLWMPQVVQRGGDIRLVRDTAGMAPERKRGWKVPAHRLIRKDRGVGNVEGPILDLRLNSPENWAHAQIFHLPLAAMATEWLGEKPTLLVTFGTPGFIKALLRHFGFTVIATERGVAGDVITPILSANDAVRPARRGMVSPLIADLDRRRAAGELPRGLPAKIFVVRRKTRRIENESEIEAMLAEQGYTKVYPETLTVPEQIELFNGATDIVGIHGAALAPLLFRSPDAPPYTMVEILSPGHMATSYRLMGAMWACAGGSSRSISSRRAISTARIPYIRWTTSGSIRRASRRRSAFWPRVPHPPGWPDAWWRSGATPAALSAFAATPTAAVVGTIGLTNLVRIFSSAILTRLLTASDYGVVGIITSITYIVAMLSDFGFFAFLVRHDRGEDEHFLDEVWTVRLIRSFGITAVLIALAVPYASYSGKMVLAPVIAVCSLNQLLEGASSLAFAQAVRGGRVQRLSWMEFGLNLFQVLATILFAFVLHNYWAIVIAVLLGGALKVVLSYALFPGSRRRFRFSRERSGEIWRFSRFIAGSSVLTLLLGQSDKVVLSRVLPLSLFGLYSLAVLLAAAPRAVVYPYCNRILYPAYSQRFRDAGTVGFAAVYYGRRRLVTLLYMAVMGGVIGAAPLIIAVLYDPRYAEVGPLMRIIAISAMLLMSNVAAEQALIAIGRTRASFQINLVRLGWLAIAGTGGFVSRGPIGLIWAVGTVEVAAMLWSWVLLGRIGALRLREEFAGLGAGGVGVATGLVLGNAILSLGWF